MASYSSFFNEDGEPLMSGEDMRAEMAADAYDEPWQYEYDDNDLSDDWDEDGCTCLDPTGAGQNTPDGAGWTACHIHDKEGQDSEPWEDEDGWLDGSYEE